MMWQWVSATGKPISPVFPSVLEGAQHLEKVVRERNIHNGWAQSCLERWRRYGLVPFVRTLVAQ